MNHLTQRVNRCSNGSQPCQTSLAFTIPITVTSCQREALGAGLHGDVSEAKLLKIRPCTGLNMPDAPAAANAEDQADVLDVPDAPT